VSEGYVHGTSPEEQRRLGLMNDLVNEGSLRELALAGGERILEMGAGTGVFARRMARAAGRSGRVVGIERSPAQLAAAEELGRLAPGDVPVELRLGDVLDPPLEPREWGSFDVVHARFLLEHLDDPVAAVRVMARAAKPGGRLVLEDDDHDVMRLWPEPTGFDAVWSAYQESYRSMGRDPLIGRKLPGILHEAGVRPSRASWIWFGACAGDPRLPVAVDNLCGVIAGAQDAILATGRVDAAEVEALLADLRAWGGRPDASFGYAFPWVEGRTPART